MIASLRFWWQNRKQASLVATGMIIVLLALIAFVFAAYRFGWSGTGFLNKTLWDWLQLLIIPLALAGVALLFNLATTRRDQQIAVDKQRGDLLQAYLDRMSELLLEKKLRGAQPDDEVFDVVRVRTTTVLCQLDGWRVGYVFVFLRGTRLMSNPPGSSLVRLAGADFRTVNWSQGYLTQANLSGTNLGGADLSRTDLSGASLTEANLTKANLSDADLSGANLSCANLTGADLSRADLRGADLSRANGTKTEQLEKARSLKDATMPDGSKHA